MVITSGQEMMPEMSGISVTGKILCQDKNEKLSDELDVSDGWCSLWNLFSSSQLNFTVD